MGASRFHKVLVFTQAIQQLPSLLIVVIFVFLAGLVAWVWGSDNVALIYLMFASLNWVSLWLLPRLRLSYGPDRPSALALALLMAVVMLLIGLLNLPSAGAYTLLALITFVAVYSTWVEPFLLRVTQQSLTSDKLKSDAPPLRLLHIGDLHMEHLSPRERRLNALIEELAPDLIVFSGDFVNISYHDDPDVYVAIRQVIGAWRAPLGVFCVNGTYTVESLKRVREFVKGLDNLRLLVDDWVSLETPGGRLYIAGMRTRHVLHEDQAAVQAMLSKAPDGAPDRDFTLWLTHAPDVIPDVDAAGADLYVCGHTHGGQIRFPLIGALFSGSHLGMQYVMGRYDLDHLTAYTTRGVGLEGLGAPRARFLCPPEIVLWQIEGSG